MAFDRLRARAGLTLQIGLRAIVLALLAFGVFELLLRTQLYATALVLVLVGVVLAFDLSRLIGRADAAMATVIEGVAADAFDGPARMPPGFEGFTAATDRALTALRHRRAEQQARIDHLQGLIDTVAAALFVLEADGGVRPINRAAQQMSARPVRRLADISALGPAAAVAIGELEAGRRAIVTLAGGRQVLASAAGFSLPGGAPSRLLALQSIVGELDVVEHKAWRDLVRILAHEMMNSLTPIVSLSDSLGERVRRRPGLDDDAEIGEAIEVIARRSSSLMRFVDRYRQVAEVPHPVRQPLRLDRFAADIARLVQAEMAERGVAFTVRVDPPNLTVDADRDLLEQAVINLVKNARQAVAEVASPRIILECREDGAQLVISVADNGPGIPEDRRHDIFVPFFSTRPDGSGVGLSLAREIALAHGGRIEASNPLGGGAEFRLII